MKKQLLLGLLLLASGLIKCSQPEINSHVLGRRLNFVNVPLYEMKKRQEDLQYLVEQFYLQKKEDQKILIPKLLEALNKKIIDLGSLYSLIYGQEQEIADMVKELEALQ